MPKTQVPLHCWPRSADDLKTLDARLGGKTSFRFGPLVERESEDKDGKPIKVRRPSWAELWVEVADHSEEAPSPTPTLKDPRLAEFLRYLAKTSAKEWAESTRQKSQGEPA